MSASSEPAGRQPFDTALVRSDDEPGLFAPPPAGQHRDKLITVTQFNRLIKGVLNKELPGTLKVVGELSNLAQPAGGHLYFTLKDRSSEVRCVMWKSSAVDLRFNLADGLEVVASGTVDVYEPRGQYQFYVRRLEPLGTGALELAFRQLKEKLQKEGLFELARKRSLPRYPRRIALVTSSTGAAIRDVLKTIARRYPAVEVLFFGVRVQGEGAAAEIADAIRRINHVHQSLGGIDVLIVGRGGGSLEDLWAFNEEIVARAIFASEIPVISAVGHEVDFTIADFVADVRAATPTAAAELVVPVMDDVITDLATQGLRLIRAQHRMLDAARARLSLVERFEWFRDPLGRIHHRQQQVDEATGRLSMAEMRYIQARRVVVHGLEVRLARVRPEAVLARRRESLSQIEHRLFWTLGHVNVLAERRLALAARRLAAATPQRTVAQSRTLTQQLLLRMTSAMKHDLDRREQALVGLVRRIDAASHARILRRGFTITRRTRGGKIVTSPDDVREYDRLETQTVDGKITSRVVDDRQRELFDG